MDAFEAHSSYSTHHYTQEKVVDDVDVDGDGSVTVKNLSHALQVKLSSDLKVYHMVFFCSGSMEEVLLSEVNSNMYMFVLSCTLAGSQRFPAETGV